MADPFSPYAALYSKPSGPGDQRPTAHQIVQDSNLLDAWSGKGVLVTGGTSGIGVETVAALHATGADVYFTARNLEKGETVRDRILGSTTGKGKLVVIHMDMDSLESVRKATNEFLQASSTLNVLINNAGIMWTPLSHTLDGFERQFGVNHLAHFLLTTLLLPTLIASSTPVFNSRVVSVSSGAHRFGAVRFGDLNFSQQGSYDPMAAYAQSKLCNVWLANYIDRVYGPQGVHANSLHPGRIMTGLQAFTPAEVIREVVSDPAIQPLMMTPAQGAATSVWAAVASVWEGKGGKYLASCRQETLTLDESGPPSDGFGRQAFDPEGEERLWDLSAKLAGV